LAPIKTGTWLKTIIRPRSKKTKIGILNLKRFPNLGNLFSG